MNMADKKNRTTLRHFTDIDKCTANQLRTIIDLAHKMKKAGRNELPAGLAKLDGLKVLAMIFEKPSTRTRLSFDMAMRQLQGQTTILNASDMQLGRGETIGDTAKILSRFVDIVMIRCNSHEDLLELAKQSTIPVINGLTDHSHPCQILADIQTFEEQVGPVKGRTLAWVGDGNNMVTSWVHAAEKFDFKLNLACPKELSPGQEQMKQIESSAGNITLFTDPVKAVKNVDCVMTDTWVSMGDKDEERRKKLLAPYQVNAKLMAKADKKAIFMHCLPAHRGEEVTNEVIDGPQSVVFDEAENRLHAQKAVLAWCLELF
ncbi:MAG: ornithine carbamoyltransferase [Hyphomicrobiaceae bacterium]|nr:ornithine carbamoyltransferase [Hyphomicrobiaceae bacterium]